MKLLYENSEFKVYDFNNRSSTLSKLFDDQHGFNMYIKTEDNCILPADLELDYGCKLPTYLFRANVCGTDVYISPNEVIEIWEKKQ